MRRPYGRHVSMLLNVPRYLLQALERVNPLNHLRHCFVAAVHECKLIVAETVVISSCHCLLRCVQSSRSIPVVNLFFLCVCAFLSGVAAALVILSLARTMPKLAVIMLRILVRALVS